MVSGPIATGALVVLAVAVVVAPGVLTMLGARRRGSGRPLAVVSGLVFPVTWVIWYVLDENPYASGRRT